MTVTTAQPREQRRPSHAARRLGYTIALAINAVMLYLVNVSPGWDAVPFLTRDTTQVIGWVNASIAAGIIANAFYIAMDPRWFRAFGEAVVTVIGLVSMVRLWQVFPFAFDDEGIPWHLVVRWLLAIGIVGSVIGVITNLVAFVARARHTG
ncbi:MAG TPA: hypothetical protein VFL94_08245 [Actinomycetales bacterium]|nr:hypothetical protein [Actinomycetales bacterium]